MITIIDQRPSNSYNPTANHINLTVNSNNSGNCNMSYICDIYVNNVRVFRDKMSPDPATGYGFFQLNRIIQDYIDNSIPKEPYTKHFNVASLTTAPTSLIKVKCIIGEEYDSSLDCSGLVTQYLNIITSNEFYAFNGAIPYEDFLDFDYTDYLMGTTTNTTKFLTNSPRVVDLNYNDSYYLDFISNQTITNLYYMRITTYSGSTVTSISSLQIPSTLLTVKRYRVGVGIYDINRIFGSPIIDHLTTSYEATLMYNGFAVSETFTFKIKCMSPFDTRFAFIGQLGSIEHYTFYHRNMKSFDIDRKTYKKTLSSNYAGKLTYEVGDRSESTYSIRGSQKNKVSTYTTREYSEWLSEMWFSPDVWTYRRPDVLPITIFRSGTLMLFGYPENHGIKVGDKVMIYPDKNDINAYSFSNQFTVTGVNGRIIDCSLLYSIFNLTELTYGVSVTQKDWSILPITISDNNIDVKQKISKPIEYSLSYMTAYPKTIIR